MRPNLLDIIKFSYAVCNIHSWCFWAKIAFFAFFSDGGIEKWTFKTELSEVTSKGQLSQAKKQNLFALCNVSTLMTDYLESYIFGSI